MKFKGPVDASSITWEGVEHEVNDGFVDLPAHAAEHIKSHGFVPHVPLSKAELEAKKKLEQQQAAEKKKAAAKAAQFVKLGSEDQLEALGEEEFSKAELEAINEALEVTDPASAEVSKLLTQLLADAG